MNDTFACKKRQWRTEALIQKLVAAIDELVSLQLSTIIQAPAYKRLESLWRGLWFMLGAVPANQPEKMIRVRIIDLSWSFLAADLEQNIVTRSSILYRLVCKQELNTLGGHPFGLLLVDHMISVLPDVNDDYDDMGVLQLLASFAKDALCPVILPVARDFLGSDDINVWVDKERVQRILASDDFQAWNRLRQQETSLFLGLTLPEFLVRSPWQDCYQNIHFNEVATRGIGSDYLWCNSAFAFAGNVLSEFHRIRWFGFLREPSGGAVVRSDTQVPASARMRITDSLEYFYSEQGLIPLVTSYLTHDLVFFNNRSAFCPPEDKDEWRLISMLQTTLMGCRFGHYLKKLIRENIGSYKDAETCESELNTWLADYVSNVDYAEDYLLAKYPLKAAKAQVKGDADLGIYQCQVEIQPQYQFDMINARIMLKTSADELKPLFTAQTKGVIK